MARKKRKRQKRSSRIASVKKENAIEETPSQDTGFSPQVFSQLSIEIWRLQRRLQTGDDFERRLQSSFERVWGQFSAGGLTVRDPQGTKYVEGMNFEILDMPDADAIHDRELCVSEVLRPAVYIDGQCVVDPQVILSVAEEENISGAS